MNLKDFVREIPDWPIKGVNFKDITPLLKNKDAFRFTIDKLSKPYVDETIDQVVVIDARGFLLGAPIAYKLKSGLSLIRKKGKLPYHVEEASFSKEYGPDTLAIHKDTINKGDNVLIIDDLLATGGTMEASVKLVEKLGGKIAGISVLIDLPFLGGSKKFTDYPLKSLITYDS